MLHLMGMMDSAVGGMVSRLATAGYTPYEAFCLAQAAYIKEGKRAQGVPPTVLKRSDTSLEINETLKRLGLYPTGTEVHRQRVILWEKIFGRGTWPEPIPAKEIYGGAPPDPEAGLEVDESYGYALIDGALRYFENKDLNFLGDRWMMTSTLFRGSGDDQKQWQGFLLAHDGTIGFFEESDCLAQSTEQGSPVIRLLSDLSECTVRIPAGRMTREGLDRISFAGDAADFYLMLRFVDDERVMRIFVPHEDLTEPERIEAAASVTEMLKILQKALELQAASAEKERGEELFDGALRYFHSVDLAYMGDRLMMPAKQYDGGTQWDGFLVAKDGMIGFFSEYDLVIDDHSEGNPAIHELEYLRGCTVRLPKHLGTPPPEQSLIRFQDPAETFLARLIFDDDTPPLQVSVNFDGLDAKGLADREKGVRALMDLAEKALKLDVLEAPK